MPVPSIGRIVHYVGFEGDTVDDHYAAVITHVWTPRLVNLELFHKGKQVQDATLGRLRLSVALDDDMAVGTWHWPELVG